MNTISVGELKRNFSDVLKDIELQGNEYIVEYGKKHKQVAVIIPIDKYMQSKKPKREFGICKKRGSFKIAKDFKMSDEELLGL